MMSAHLCCPSFGTWAIQWHKNISSCSGTFSLSLVWKSFTSAICIPFFLSTSQAKTVLPSVSRQALPQLLCIHMSLLNTFNFTVWWRLLPAKPAVWGLWAVLAVQRRSQAHQHVCAIDYDHKPRRRIRADLTFLGIFIWRRKRAQSVRENW